MKKSILVLGLLLSAPSVFAAKKANSGLCYKACTLETYQVARESCTTAANTVNKLSNETVQMIASCSKDSNGSECGRQPGGLCMFPDIVLDVDFIVH